MKVFSIIRRRLAAVGIASSNRSNRKYPINGRIILGFLILGFIFSSQFVYTLYVANGLMEYVEVVGATSASALVFVSFTDIVSKQRLLFESIDGLEKLIESSKAITWAIKMKFHSKIQTNQSVSGCKNLKSMAHFSISSQHVKRMGEIVFTLMMKIFLQCVILPDAVGGFAVYFFTDSEDDLFELPIPLW